MFQIVSELVSGFDCVIVTLDSDQTLHASRWLLC